MVVNLLFGCGNGGQSEPVIASVGNKSVTRTELMAGYGLNASRFDTSDQNGRIRLEEAARRWAMDEILIQEAIKLHLDQDSSFKARLENLHDTLLEDLLLERACNKITIDSSEIIEQYETHRAEYTLTEDEVDFIYVAALTRELARIAQNELRNGTPLSQILASNVQLSGEEAGWVKKNYLHPGLAKTLFTLAPGGVSAPIKLEDSEYVVVMARQRRQQGTVLPLNEVYDQIAGHLYLAEKLQVEKALRDSLWMAYNPHIMVSHR